MTDVIVWCVYIALVVGVGAWAGWHYGRATKPRDDHHPAHACLGTVLLQAAEYVNGDSGRAWTMVVSRDGVLVGEVVITSSEMFHEMVAGLDMRCDATSMGTHVQTFDCGEGA